jgi:uncharacterized protein
MIIFQWLRYWVIFICLNWSLPVWAELTVPQPIAPVIDQTSFLTSEEVQNLNNELLTFHQKTGSQIAVLIVSQTDPETPFDYGMRVLNQWKLGRKGIDDGVLLLLVPEDKKTQILVGRGLEGSIPDAYAKRILEDILRPLLKEDKRFEGILAATQQMQRLIEGEKLPPPRPAAGLMNSLSGEDLIFIAMMALFVQGILTSIFGRFLGSSITGALAGGVALTLGFEALLALGIAFGITILSLFLKSHGISTANGRFGGGLGGGWSGGGGGFGGGGGWSGGGGGFGGGGASGGW